MNQPCSIRNTLHYDNMVNNQNPRATSSRPLPPTPVEHGPQYRPVQLDDIRNAPPPSTTSHASHPPPHHHHHRHQQAVLHHTGTISALSRYERGARTISTIKASHAASTSIERSDNHRAMIHYNNENNSLSLRERYLHGRKALQERPAGSEFVFMWDAVDKLKRVLVRAMNKRAANKSQQTTKEYVGASRAKPYATVALSPPPPSQISGSSRRDGPLPPPPPPSTTHPTPIYEAHRKHRSHQPPREFYLAWAAVKDLPPTPSRLPSLTIKRKPAPTLETASQYVQPHFRANAGASKNVRPLRSDSYRATLDKTSTTPPRTLSLSKKKIDRMTRLSELMRPRIQSNILTGSNKQLRPCEVCGISSSAAIGGKFSEEGLWLCIKCQHSDGSSGELPPLSAKRIQQGLGVQSSTARMVWGVPLGKDLVWNCEHCFASFSSAPPASGHLCICPMCKGEITAHSKAIVSRSGSNARRSSNVSHHRRRRSSPSTWNETSRFSEATDVSETGTTAGKEDLVARPSVYRPSLYEDEPVLTHDSPVSPIGQGKFDHFDISSSGSSNIHPAFRPLPKDPSLPRRPSMKRPDTEWRNSMSTPIPGLDKARSRHTGPNTYLTYESAPGSSNTSAATTAMDLSLALTPQPPAPAPTPVSVSTIAYFNAKTKERQEVAGYQNLGASKRLASSIYPEDQEERVYADDEGFSEVPKLDSQKHNLGLVRANINGSDPLSHPPALTMAHAESGLWPVNTSNGTLPVDRGTSFYGVESVSRGREEE